MSGRRVYNGITFRKEPTLFKYNKIFLAAPFCLVQIVNSAKRIVILIVQIYVQECKFNIIIVVSDI